MTHNRFSNFHCVYTVIQVVYTEFIKVVLSEYSAFKSSRKMIQKQAAEAVIVVLISEKNKSKKKKKKSLKRRKKFNSYFFSHFPLFYLFFSNQKNESSDLSFIH